MHFQFQVRYFSRLFRQITCYFRCIFGIFLLYILVFIYGLLPEVNLD